MKKIIQLLTLTLMAIPAYLGADDSPEHVYICGVIAHHDAIIEKEATERGCPNYRSGVKPEVIEYCLDVLSRNDFEYTRPGRVYPEDNKEFRQVLCELIITDNGRSKKRAANCPKMQELGSIFTDEILAYCLQHIGDKEEL